MQSALDSSKPPFLFFFFDPPRAALLETNFTAALGAVQRGDGAREEATAGGSVSGTGTQPGQTQTWAPVTALCGRPELVRGVSADRLLPHSSQSSLPSLTILYRPERNASLTSLPLVLVPSFPCSCGYLLSAAEVRLPACDFLKLLAARRRQQEDAEAFDAAMGSPFAFSISAAKESLQRLSSSTSNQGEGMNGRGGGFRLQTLQRQSLRRGCVMCSVAMTPTNLHRLVQRDDSVLPRLMDVVSLHPASSCLSGKARSWSCARCNAMHVPHAHDAMPCHAMLFDGVM